jgi:hypothetical protein
MKSKPKTSMYRHSVGQREVEPEDTREDAELAAFEVTEHYCPLTEMGQ